MQRRDQPACRATPRLPSDAWYGVACNMQDVDCGALISVCKDARDSVFNVLSERYGLNSEQVLAFAAVVMLGKSVFLTSGAGCGKTFCTKTITDVLVKQLGEGRVAVCAPTGTAARQASTLQLKAQTVHLLFGIQNRARLRGSQPFVFYSSSTRDADMEGDGEQLQHEQQANSDEDEDEPSASSGERALGAPTAHITTQVAARLKALRVLILDEVSMVSAEMLDVIDATLRAVRGATRPWGGCVVLAAGDFHQLSPVQTTRDLLRSDGKVFAFESDVWSSLKPLQLTQVVRQNDPTFAAVLNRVRVGKATWSDVHWLERNSTHFVPGKEARRAMFQSNKRCEARNLVMMARETGEEAKFHASRYCLLMPDRDNDDFTWVSESNLSGPIRYPSGRFAESLTLRVGARVACIKNMYSSSDAACRVLLVSNGQMGTVTGYEYETQPNAAGAAPRPTGVHVKWDALSSTVPKTTTVVRPVAWSKRQKFKHHGRKVKAVTRQLPLLPGFARTVHASQGASIETEVDVDPLGWTRNASGKWVPCPALAYVALSRVTRVGLLRLVGRISPDKVVADARVVAYYASVFG